MKSTFRNISIQQAESLLLELFNISGKATSLPGYIDCNFKLISVDGDVYILKVSRQDEDSKYLDFQNHLLQHVAEFGNGLIVPRIVVDREGRSVSSFVDAEGNQRMLRLLTWVPGRLWGDVNPQLDDLRYSLGERCGLLTKALQDFEHSYAHRELEWDVARSLWTTAHLDLFKKEEKRIVIFFQNRFKKAQKSYVLLRKAIVHNDANDNNIIVSEDLIKPKVKAVIDYGDAVYTQVINDVAITCAYAIMGHNDPLQAALPIVTGYFSRFPLEERELKHLYDAIAMRLVVSVTKSAINKSDQPDNAYLLISEKPGWEVLEKWSKINADFAYYSFRQACGFTPHPFEQKFKSWATNHTFLVTDLFPTIKCDGVHLLDLSVSSRWLGMQSDFDDTELFQFKIDRLQREHPNKVIAGGYLEPRGVYTTSEYGRIGNSGPEYRTVHLGVDFWLPASTPVHALMDGEVVTAINDAGNKEYGGLIILKHTTETLSFYTLYGHLSVASIQDKVIGDIIGRGERIGFLGIPEENGNWAPHLHFQIMLSMLGYTKDFPGVGYISQINIWKGICPNPNVLFKSTSLQLQFPKTNDHLINFRKQHLGKSLSLQYRVPIQMVRGAGQYLMDQYGRKYLDTVNNVAHVGHEHPEVVRAGQQQMALINTNSRYLHENINELAKEILATLPPELSVLHFVNSGSEANELALRMAKAASGHEEIIASEFGYHGNTNRTVAISSYKFDGKGGQGTPEHTHIFPLPDAFRGKYRGENTGVAYAEEVKRKIEIVHEKGMGVSALIVEPIISCGGQIELPAGFLKKAYDYVRAAGGLCISDEVQVGCGRLGKTFWGFQLHDVLPDIITIGKPLGNGHPLAAVACTTDVAEKFANGMEYFNTFGGNPVSCAIGTEVLRTVKREKLQQHALQVGEFLKSELIKLALEHPIIGNVRGQGFFLGFELTDADRSPLQKQADYLVNRMKDYSILMSTDGPDNNVLKIKPPMVFSIDNAKEILHYLRIVLNEDVMIKI